MKTRDLFTTIRTEGGLLPTDLLQRLVNRDKGLPGLDDAAYHLVAGERLNERISQSWKRLLGAWNAFRTAADALPESDTGTTLTRERWLLVLFQELEYGRLPVSRAMEIDGRSYAISHFWHHSPIHLVSYHVDLDRRTPGVAGAARTSPHSLVQEFLNRSDDDLWGFVSNGLRLRILRDNISLTRQAFVEFDLEGMMDGEVYADFVLLWLLGHQSRVEAEKSEACWLERWARAAQEQGTRALDRLRDGVEKAIEALGRGFLAHPANAALRDNLRSGNLDKQDYYRQLLRLVYRLLFLFVAEDRDLLYDPTASPEARERFTRYYATGRLRHLAERHRGTKHLDLYRGLRIVMEKLGSDDGCPPLALPALGGFLWSERAIRALAQCEISNRDFLDAIRALAFTLDNKTLRAVDYKNLGSEELGSIYESLLELHPDLNTDAATFDLTTAGGHERKTTGSYYTPASLIQCLLDSALDPVLDEAARQPNAEQAILALKVCDPACGSGHFLIAAAHRMARRLAAIRTGDEEPAPEATRTALRDVISHCIYGVDVNPMAVELCKVSLWMESVEPGKPLTFLDHHIQCGNSLLGTTPALLAKGIPDDAFKPIEGDDKAVASALRKRNKIEREGQMTFDAIAETGASYGSLTDRIASLEAIDDSSIIGIHEKEERYNRLAESAEYRKARLVANAWCAAFVWKKTRDVPEPVTHDVFYRLMTEPEKVPTATRAEIARLAEQFRFFHWHLAFPEVFRIPEGNQAPENEMAGWIGGFDIVLGNPPWDTLSPDTKEFFSTYDPEIRFQDRDGQTRIIAKLLENWDIAERWDDYCRVLYTQVHFFKQSGYYRLFAPGNLGKGDFNIYRMFVETALQIAWKGRQVAQIVPEGLYSGTNCMAIRKELFEACELDKILGFENTGGIWFTGIHRSQKFCVYSARTGGHTKEFRAAFNLRGSDQLRTAMAGATLHLPVTIVREFSPDALAIMEFSSQHEIDIATKMYARWPKFGDESAGPPHRQYMREIDMGNDRQLFSEDPSGLPLYEGRMVAQYDHRAKGYRSGRGRSAEWKDLPFSDSAKSVQPQWHIPKNSIPDKAWERVQRYRIGFCDVASPTNERTLVAALIPPFCICGHTVPTITFEPDYECVYMIWLSVANSFAMDFLARKKVSLHMSYAILDSLPFPRLASEDPLAAKLVPLALYLTCAGPEMTAYWNLMAEGGWVKPVPPRAVPPGIVNDTSRLEARAELEAIVARDIFDLSRQEIDHIMETFPTVKRNDVKQYGDYRTKLMILDIYDRMQQAMDTGEPYQTLLEPPPADPRVAHPPRTEG